MHRKTIFSIRIDFEKSHDSYIYDKSRNDYFLDFFGLYATLPLGYSHPIFQDESFRKDFNRIASVKVPNNEIISDEAQEFLKTFAGHRDMSGYKYFHFCCTGALAIESAIKVAIDQKPCRNPMVISLKESFHGINSYGGFVTDRFFPVSLRLDNMPDMGWYKIHNPKIIYRDNKVDEKTSYKGLEKFEREFDGCIKKFGADSIVALLIEPIQSTYGDNYFPEKFFQVARKLCDKYNICLIFDEIQTGFGGTGKMWYFQHINIEPDIVTFGKKTQVAGIMVKEKYNKLFETPIRLEVTWDGNLLDMVRCNYILKAYEKYNILDNVDKRGEEIVCGLKNIKQLKNVRSTGLLICFDFDSAEQCQIFFKKIFEKRLLCNKTRDISIRLRPNLNLTSAEVQEALRRIKSALE